MADRAHVPPLRALLRGGPDRQTAVRHWLRDPAMGGLNLGLHHALRALPTDWCSAFGAANAGLSARRYSESDARARRLWRALRPLEASPAEVDAAMRRLWRSVSRTMAEYSVLHRLWDEGCIAVTVAEHLRAAGAAGRKVLMAGLHLGNWEVIGAALLGLGFRGSATFEPPENRFEYRIVDNVRRSYGGRVVVPSHAAGRQIYRLLKDSDEEGFLFYVDEFDGTRVSAPFFGREPRLAGNIANILRMARMADAEVAVGHCVRIGDRARFAVTFSPMMPQVRTGDARADLAANVAALEALIAPIVTAHLDQWYYALDFEPDPS